MHDAANRAHGSQPASPRGKRLLRHSASRLPLTAFDYSFRPEHILHAVFYDDQRMVDGILAAGGKQELRGAIIWRVSKQTIEKLYAVGCCDHDFVSNLFSAAAFGRPETVEALLNHTGLTPDTLNLAGHYLSSLLYAAARAGHGDIVRNLLARGADPHTGRFMRGFLGRRKYHVTPLEAAVRGGHSGVVRQFLEHTPSSERELRKLLDGAVHDEAPACCQVLLEHGAHLSASAQKEITALDNPLLKMVTRRSMTHRP